MKQVVLRGGAPTVAEVPAPSPAPGHVLVANAASLISSGTERAAVSASGGGGSLPMRAIRNPDLVLLTLKYAKEHGVRDTVEAVRNAVSDDTVLGYSCAGVVLDTGGIADFRVGQHVACAGAGRANHAEVVSVPGNLVAAVPDGVSLRDAAFTTVGAIAMQGVRRAEPQLGERVVVVGLGLIGLITVQLLRAAGCRVLGVEPSAERRALGEQLGAERVVTPDAAPAAVKEWTGGVGADATLITASSSGDAIVNQAIEMLRRKGRVVVVGDVGLAMRARPDLPARGRLPDLDLLRARALRPDVRGGRARLPDRLRALDREPQHGGVPAPAVGRARCASSRSWSSSCRPSARPRPTRR